MIKASPISQLMTIFTENDAYDTEKFPATSRRKRHFKEDEKGVGEMCEIMREAVQEAVEETSKHMIVGLYKRSKLTLSEACEELNCTPEEFEGYLKEYTKQKKNR